MPAELFGDDPEKTRELAAKGGRAAADLKRLKKDDPEAYIARRFSAERAGLTTALLDAAFGRGTFAQTLDIECRECGNHTELIVPALPPDKRLGAVIKGLEYAVGKPQAGKATGGEEKPKAPEPGLEVS